MPTSRRSDDYRPRPGFQGSETTLARATIYGHGGVKAMPENQQVIELDGKRINDDNASLIAASCTKSLGSPTGNFTLTLKPSYQSAQILRSVLDDDWVDLTFYRHGRVYHTMRGLVDEVRQNTVVAGSGATSTVFTVSGRDFGKVFDMTKLWFNIHNNEPIAGALAYKVFSNRSVRAAVDVTVEKYLFDFLKELADVGRANWVMPEKMPGIGGEKFIDHVTFYSDDYLDNPARLAIDPNFTIPTGSVLDLATEFSDPMFCELIMDLFIQFGEGHILPQDADEELPIADSRMTVMLRDKPFPTIADGQDSPYFNLPLHIVPREQIVSIDVGRSGHERYNAFFVVNQLSQEMLGSHPDLMVPLWDADDILRHGFRRMDVNSRYIANIPSGTDLLGMPRAQREKIRDWYAINPYLYSGSINLGVGRPEIRIGTRVRVPGAASESTDQTYYVESVSTNWQYGQGLTTSLGVTRGWIGTDSDYLDTLDLITGRYELPVKAEPGS